MRILYQVPHLNTNYAGRTINSGYEHAFKALGHEFRYLTADDNQDKLYSEYKPDILFTSLHYYPLKYLDLKLLKKQQGMKVFVNTPFWVSPFSTSRINEAASLKANENYIQLIRSGDYGDVYYNVCEQGDPRMEGFETVTGYKYHTVLLAADDSLNYYEPTDKFKHDIAFLGTNLPDKRDYFAKHLYPLRDKYDLKLYGQDWTAYDRILGLIQKFGHLFNLPIIKNIQKPSLRLEDERRIYSSTTVNLNIHEHYQRKFGGDCNERTFKIPLCGGFEIVDNVNCIKKYLEPDKEIVIAQNTNDWFEKIEYYIKNPEKRLPIIEAGSKKVRDFHTYKNRVKQFEEIYKNL